MCCISVREALISPVLQQVLYYRWQHCGVRILMPTVMRTHRQPLERRQQWQQAVKAVAMVVLTASVVWGRRWRTMRQSLRRS